MKYIPLILLVGFTVAYSDSRHSINDLIVMAINTHPSIKLQQQIIKGANAQVDEAMWNYFPTPSISSFETAKRVHGATLAIEQPLLTGGKLNANYDLAFANKKSSEFALKDSEYTLIETLLENIQTYMQGENTYTALLEGQKQLHILQDMVQRRITAGVSSEADMELLMARLYQVETDLNLAKTKRATALAQIELITGREFDDKLVLDLSAPVISSNIGEIINDAMSTHPLLRKLDAQREYAKAELDKSKANIWPTLSIKAQQNFGSTSMAEDIKSDNSPFFYLSLQASPGAGLSAFSAVEGSRAKILESEQEILVAKQSIINKIIFTYNDYNSANKRIGSQSKSVGSSQKVFASYTRLFLAGKRQWLDLVNASREVTQNEIAFSDAKVILLISAYKLELLRGKGNVLNMASDNKLVQIGNPTKPIEQLTIINQHNIPDSTPPAPPAPAPITIIEKSDPIVLQRIDLSADALFAFGKSQLGNMFPKGRGKLDELAKEIQSSNINVEKLKISGYTDRLGSNALNMKLSQARAQTVVDYFKAHGIAIPMEAVGYGSSSPITTWCKGPRSAKLIECLQPDRRVSIELIGQKTLSK